MSDETRCEPQEHRRRQDGWHWVQCGEQAPAVLAWQWDGRWLRVPPKYEWQRPDNMARLGYRYIAPVDQPEDVDALAEAIIEIVRAWDKETEEKVKALKANMHPSWGNPPIYINEHPLKTKALAALRRYHGVSATET